MIFGHTHRRGGPERRRGAALWNVGSWVHSPGLLGETAAVSPYWPGTVGWSRTRASPSCATCSTTSAARSSGGR